MSSFELSLLICGVFGAIALAARWLMRRVATGCTCSRDRCEQAVQETVSAARLAEHALEHYTRSPNG